MLLRIATGYSVVKQSNKPLVICYSECGTRHLVFKFRLSVMSSYPSWDGELRELYQSKGHRALVWLAWRAAAKYLPLLIIEIDQPEDNELRDNASAFLH